MRRLTRRPVVLLLPLLVAGALAALLAGGERAGAPEVGVPPGYFGINGAPLKTSGDRDKHATAIAALGIKSVRADILWHTTEPYAPVEDEASPGGYKRYFKFASYDPFVKALANAGLTWRPLVFGSPGWNRPAESTFHAVPDKPEFLAGWATAFLQRYGVNGTFWKANPTVPAHPVRWLEVWNEGNFAPSNNGNYKYPAEKYGALLKAAGEGVHAHDPEAKVVVGGLVPHLTTTSRGVAVGEYLAKVAEAEPGAATQSNGIAVHIYGHVPATVLGTVGDVRKQVETTPFAGQPLHLNETGSSVAPGSEHGEENRANYLEEMARLSAARSGSACNLGSFVPYTWITLESDPNNREHWYGIANPDATPKPSSTAYGTGIGSAVPGDDPCQAPAG